MITETRLPLIGVAIASIMGASQWGHASDASSSCEERTGIKVSVDVSTISSEAVTFGFSVKNVSSESLEVTQASIPWLDFANVSVVLLDWRSGSSLEHWIVDSKIKFDLSKYTVGAFRSRKIQQLIDSVGGILGPGDSLRSEVEYSVSPQGFSLSESDLARIRQERAFLWTIRVDADGIDCLQAGISEVR